MEIDNPPSSDDETPIPKQLTTTLTRNSPLSLSLSKLSATSRILPTSPQDFHFYNNFVEFKVPVQGIEIKSRSLQQTIGSSEELFMNPIMYPDDKSVELDDRIELDYVVNTNDELYDGVDESLDEFKKGREGDEDDGFKVVMGKKERKGEGVKVAVKIKPKVPFHVPSIVKPQDEFKINVNNSNVPFEHVWLERSVDGTRFLHPLVSF